MLIYKLFSTIGVLSKGTHHRAQKQDTKPIPTQMDSIDVLMLVPMYSYLEQELDKRFNVLKLWTVPHKSQFIKDNSSSIRAIVGTGGAGADAELIESLPKLEIISSFSVGMDKVDLKKCKEKGIQVTNTPDVLTDDVADIAIGLALAVMRRLCESDRYVRSGQWKKGDFKLTTKVKSSFDDL